MRVLVACEESQEVTKAFRALGHEAFSCDILPPSGGCPDWHFQNDVREILSWEWDLVIAHPPCDFLTTSNNRALTYGCKKYTAEMAREYQREAIAFFMLFTELSCRTAIENPKGIMSTKYRKPDQIIQPWMFGHGEVKQTHLWLNDLPPLQPTEIVPGREPVVHYMWPTKEDPELRSRLRSKTYPGIAKAMAVEWGRL